MILVVDDDLDLLELMADGLEARGHLVAAAATGRSALTLLRQLRTIEVLVTDLAMPGLNGRELAVEARAMAPALRVVFVSGCPDDYLNQAFLDEMGALVLTKPFALAELVETVEVVLSRQTPGL